MEAPQQLRYSQEHEWVLVEEDNLATIGITDYAQDQLGDVVFVELPEPDTRLTQDEPFGVVESVKAVSDIYAPVSGMVKEVNTELLNTPETLNEDPYGDAWLVQVEMNEPEELDALMTAEEYERFVEEERESADE
jgi:glycine cleavage system H protein